MTITQKDIEQKRAALAMIGRDYPSEFINSIADNAAAVVGDWLEKNNAPEALVDLFSSTIMLYQFAQRAEGKILNDLDAADLTETIANATKLINELGGLFYSASGSISAPKPPPAGVET